MRLPAEAYLSHLSLGPHRKEAAILACCSHSHVWVHMHGSQPLAQPKREEPHLLYFLWDIRIKCHLSVTMDLWALAVLCKFEQAASPASAPAGLEWGLRVCISSTYPGVPQAISAQRGSLNANRSQLQVLGIHLKSHQIWNKWPRLTSWAVLCQSCDYMRHSSHLYTMPMEGLEEV